MRVLEEFRQYADFSVRVDRYFHMINIYGNRHSAIRAIYNAMPSRDTIEIALASEMDENLKQFLLVAVLVLQEIATTNVFSDEGNQVCGDVSEDVSNFAFYTCYCFQWSLFEHFVKTMVRKVIDAGALRHDIVRDLESKWRRTKQFFDKIDSGDVFGTTPFTALLPVMGWVWSTEEVSYNDLNEIRGLRNNFIHGVESPEIISESIGQKQQRYNRSMWILRKFAENVQWEAQQAMGIGNE